MKKQKQNSLLVEFLVIVINRRLEGKGNCSATSNNMKLVH